MVGEGRRRVYKACTPPPGALQSRGGPTGSNLINNSKAAYSSLSHIRPDANPSDFLQASVILFIYLFISLTLNLYS